MKVKLSWTEQFMNWYPRNTKLYRRRNSKLDSDNALENMKKEFDELKSFFIMMEESIKRELK